jgi:hypothetical protein
VATSHTLQPDSYLEYDVVQFSAKASGFLIKKALSTVYSVTSHPVPFYPIQSHPTCSHLIRKFYDMKSTENYMSHSSFLFLVGTVCTVYRVPLALYRGPWTVCREPCTVHRTDRDRLHTERHRHVA